MVGQKPWYEYILATQPDDAAREHRAWRAEMAELDRALDLDPQNTALLTKRVLLFARAGRYHEAMADCNRILAIQPDSPEVLGARAALYEALALDDFARLMELRPTRRRSRPSTDEQLRARDTLIRALPDRAGILGCDTTWADGAPALCVYVRDNLSAERRARIIPSTWRGLPVVVEGVRRDDHARRPRDMQTLAIERAMGEWRRVRGPLAARLHLRLRDVYWACYRFYRRTLKLPRRVRRFWQRGRRGWSTEDAWSLNSYLARIIADAVDYQRRHGHSRPVSITEAEWDRIRAAIATGYREWLATEVLATPGPEYHYGAALLRYELMSKPVEMLRTPEMAKAYPSS